MNQNNFAGCCANRNCPNGHNRADNKVGVKKGFIVRGDGGWKVFCVACAPANQQAAGRRELTVDGKLYTPYDKDNLVLIQSLPQPRKWDKPGKFWQVSLDPAHRPRLLEVCQRLNVAVPAALAKIELTALSQAAHDAGVAFGYQVEGIDWITKNEHCLLGDDMGLGKTLQAIMAIGDDPTLVVCPANVKHNWMDEINKWRPELNATVIDGKANFAVPTQKRQVFIVNYELLPAWLETKVEGKGKNRKFISQVPAAWEGKIKNIVLVGDEVQKVKNYKTARAKRYSNLSRLVKRSIHMTGTPFENGSRADDLFGVLCSCNLIGRTFGTRDRMAKLWGAFKISKRRRGGGFINTYDWPLAPPIISETLRRVMLRRTKAEVLPQLPPKIYKTLVCNDMPADLARQLERKMGEWVEWYEDEHGELPVVDGFKRPPVLPPFEMFSSIRARLAEARIPAMVSFVDNCEEQDVPLLVFSAHRKPIEELKDRDGWEIITGDTPTIKRQDIVRRFQNGELKGVGSTIRAGGVGLTLTEASTVYFVDLEWNPPVNEQAVDRVCRIGQEAESILVVWSVSDHILDKHVLFLLADKTRKVAAAIDQQLPVNNKNEPAVFVDADPNCPLCNQQHVGNCHQGEDEFKPPF